MAKRLLAILYALFAAILLANGAQCALAAESDYYTDLSHLLTSMHMYVDGEEVADGDEVYVRDGMLYDLVLTFRENAEKQFSNTDQMYFDLPTGFVLPDDFADTLTISLGIDGKVYGNVLSYDKTNNRLLLDWNKLDRKYQRLIASGNLRFTVDLQGYIMPGEVSYGDAYSFTAVRYDPHNASVTKMGSIDRTDIENQMMTYTVVVTSDGSNENLTMTDVLGTALSYDGTLKWKRTSLMSSQQSRETETADVALEATDEEPYLYSRDDGTMTIIIPEMMDGDVITFTYTADIDYDKISTSGKASMDETANTVQIFGDSDPVDNISVWHQKEVAYSSIEKECEGPGTRYTEDDREYQNITWTIDTNEEMMVSFRGTEIADHVTNYDGVSDVTTGVAPITYTGAGITIHVYELDATTHERIEVETRQVPWSELDTSSDLDATKGWTYHVPETDGIYEYEISYQTKSDVTDLNRTVRVVNDAISRGGEDEATTLLHPKGTGLGISKKAVSWTAEETTWNINITLNDIEDGYNGELVFEDVMPYKYITDPDTGTMTLYKDTYKSDSLEISGLQEGESYTVSVFETPGWANSNNSPRVDARYSGNKGQTFDNNSNILIVRFFQDEEKVIEGLRAPVDGGSTRTLSLTLTTKNSEAWSNAAWKWIDEKRGDYWYLNHQNYAYINTSYEQDTISLGHYRLYKSFKTTFASDKYESWMQSVSNQFNHLDVEDEVLYAFETYVSNTNGDDSIVIEDMLDTSLFMLLWNKDYPGDTNITFRAGDSPHYANAVVWTQGEHDSSIEEIDGGYRFTIGELPLKPNGMPYSFYGVEYKVIVRDQEAYDKIQMEAYEQGGIARYINTAKYKDLTDHDTYTIELKPKYKPLDKSDATITESKTMAEYTLVINQRKQQLNGGDPITVDDEFENLSVDYSTITIVTDPRGREEQVSYDYSGNVGTFTVPDETKVMITYSARIIPPEGTVYEGEEATVVVKNVATMLGWNDGGETRLTINKSASADNYRIRAYKYGSGHMEKGLNGAVFGLYTKEGNDYIPVRYRSGSQAGQPVKFTTGTVKMLNGVIISENEIAPEEADQVVERDGYAEVILNQHEHGIVLTTDVTYYLHEETAPEDYVASDVYYSFTFGDEPDYSGGVYIYYNNDILKVRDKPSKGAFALKKELTGNYALSQQEQSSLRFTIQKKNGDVWEDQTVENAAGEETTELTYADIRSLLTIEGITAGFYRVVERHALPGNVEENVSFTMDGVEEDLTDGCVVFEITQDDIDNGLTHEIAIVDSYSRETVTLSVRKAWLDAEGRSIPPAGAEVTIGVYVKGADMPIQTVTLTGEKKIDSSAITGESAAWVAQFANLPAKDENGGVIEYVAREISGPRGYEISTESVALNKGEQPVITNRQETVTLTIAKQWVPAAGSAVPSDTAATLGIYYDLSAERAYQQYLGGKRPYKTVVLTVDMPTATIADLPKADAQGNDYVFIAVETAENAGYAAAQPYIILSETSDENVFANVERYLKLEISGEKQLRNASLESRQFTFVLEQCDASGNVLAGSERLTAQNDQDGSFHFELEYVGLALPICDEGWLYYLISEQVPEDAVDGVKDQILYDLRKYLAAVKVTCVNGVYVAADPVLRVIP